MVPEFEVASRLKKEMISLVKCAIVTQTIATNKLVIIGMCKYFDIT